MKSLLQRNLKIVFHPWVTNSVHLQPFVWGIFLLEGGLKAKATVQRTSLWSV